MFDCETTHETRCHVSFSRVSVPERAQNCFGLSSPVSFLVSGRRRLPSPPAKITPQRCEQSLSTMLLSLSMSDPERTHVRLKWSAGGSVRPVAVDYSLFVLAPYEHSRRH